MNLRLRPTVLSDIDKIMEWVNDPEVLMKFANFKPVTREQELLFLHNLIQSPDDKTFTVENENSDYIGQVSINKIYWPARNGKLALVIHPDKRGQGYIRTIIELIVKQGFNMGLHKLWLMIREDNIKGKKLYRSLGFTIEATLIDEYIDPLTGQFVNMIRLYQLNPKDLL